MPNDIKALKAKRKQLIGTLTRFSKHVSTLTDVSEINFKSLEKRLKLNEPAMSTFRDLQVQIESIEDDLDLQEDEDFEEMYFACTSQAEELLVHRTDTTEATKSPSTNVTSNVKLPTLHLPTFNGAFEDWLPFHDTFNSLIHENDNISNVQKFHYLKSTLKGDAAITIKSLQVTNDNYQVAWTTLRNRYENRKLIVDNHLKNLFNLPVVEKESAHFLRAHLDNFLKNVRALEAINEPSASTLLVYISTMKLDSTTKDKWEEYRLKIQQPTISHLTEFLESRCQVLDSRPTETLKSISSQQSRPHHTNASKQPGSRSGSSITCVTFEQKCEKCKENHMLYQCPDFHQLSPSARLRFVREWKLCINCMKSDHPVSLCKSGACRKCNKRHNTLLHLQESSSGLPSRTTSTTTDPGTSGSTASQSFNAIQPTKNIDVLLTTALVFVTDSRSKLHKCRVLLDNGSQSNFITTRLATILNLPVQDINIPISGIGSSQTSATKMITTTIQSRVSSYSQAISCLVIDRITDHLPVHNIPAEILQLPDNIELADPTFYQSSSVDMLIGASIFWDLLHSERIKLYDNGPVIQSTLLGWIISGNVPIQQQPTRILCHVNQQLESIVRKFWEMEEVSVTIKAPEEHTACETYFRDTTTHDNGRFTVRLPFNRNITEVGSSYNVALKQLFSLEKRLRVNTSMQKLYNEFMSEYISLGHMTEVDSTQGIFLPHHGVYKESSSTTKLRVVFNGSSKTTTGISLNDSLMAGPVVQDELWSILLRFRQHKYVLTADVEKMYRQVMIHHDDRHFQQILWRSDPNSQVKAYQLNTITYGTTSAPYLATRCLNEALERHSDTYPETVAIGQRDFYVDDLLTGADTIENTCKARDELSLILQKSGFILRKWRSNDEAISSITEPSSIPIDKNATMKTLGVLWNNCNDTFHYEVTLSMPEIISKRVILSSLAQIYDPIGLIAPITVRAKIILQQSWKTNVDWDAPVSSSLQNDWKSFVLQLRNLSQLSIPRNVVVHSQSLSTELHGFCDASEKAFGACIYIRTTDNQGISNTRLLCSKSRVAPIKTVTLPRLELCGSLLLAQLAAKVERALDLKLSARYFWTDSTIALAWIQKQPHDFKIFIANRITQINELTSKTDWRHVRTHDNPADLVSRGTNPDDLSKSDLWWSGPQFLKLPTASWPTLFHTTVEELPELKRTTISAVVTPDTSLDLFTRWSSLTKLKRITALCLRFAHNTRVPEEQRQVGSLSPAELQTSLEKLITLSQRASFQVELNALSTKSSLPKSSKILRLNPFLDDSGILRVGGRLAHANVPYEQQHPAILPTTHPLTYLIVNYEHLRQLHGGPQSILATIRTRYWPVFGRSTVKKILRQCVRCCRVKPRFTTQIMGNLPLHRTQPIRPFLNTGVDFCGPFQMVPSHRRGVKSTKGYVAVFICLSTKAVHLEIVSDLTTDAFINSIKRFISRRGRVSNFYSDNGTNFKGADHELCKLRNLFLTQLHKNKLDATLANEGMKWNFIPPRTPHFGGLWEAAVKSAKKHFVRVAGNAALTYEEFSTLLTQIEACLNSRPLTAMTDDPDDVEFLTPGHFLVGASLTAIPEPDLAHLPINRLSRLQRLTQMTGHFWKIWSRNYLTMLQERSKWKTSSVDQLEVGNMVVIKEDNLPPLRWHLGRVTELHPGIDGTARVASVRTSKKISKIAIHRLCPLPIDRSD